VTISAEVDTKTIEKSSKVGIAVALKPWLVTSPSFSLLAPSMYFLPSWNWCKQNSLGVPSPCIFWYLQSTDFMNCNVSLRQFFSRWSRALLKWATFTIIHARRIMNLFYYVIYSCFWQI
jgi:hypothetical protein